MMMEEEPTNGLASWKPFDQPEQPYSPPPAGVAVAAARGGQRHGGGGAHKRSVLLEPAPARLRCRNLLRPGAAAGRRHLPQLPGARPAPLSDVKGLPGLACSDPCRI